MTIRELYEWGEENGCLDVPLHCPGGYVDEAELGETSDKNAEVVCLYTAGYCLGGDNA